ncbi:MAG: DUF2892 domain-containing protein [Bacteroidetes bacterium]|nr:MAG: DUF2892 domain-containing protein [Bacteroidota bacterium]
MKGTRLTLVLIFLVVFFSGIARGIGGFVLLGLATIFMVTTLVGVCPPYKLLGINTSKKDHTGENA